MLTDPGTARTQTCRHVLLDNKFDSKTVCRPVDFIYTAMCNDIQTNFVICVDKK